MAVELRDEIYAMAFAAETNDDDSIELYAAQPPSKALVMTCRVIRSETHAMYRAAYQSYPKHTFTLDVDEYDHSCAYAPPVPDLSNDLFAHMVSIRLHWRANERHKGDPIQFTSHLDRNDHHHRWTSRVELHDNYWRGQDCADRLMRWYGYYGFMAMERFRGACEWQSGRRLSDALAVALAQAMRATPPQENSIWRDDAMHFSDMRLRTVSVRQQRDRLQRGEI